ncbi:MAG: beta-ketoacyl-ACP synthase 3 [Actinomycetes bacterium]
MTTLRLPPASSDARILGLGAHLPARVVGNEEIAAAIGSSDEWIVQRSGITHRHFAAPDETVVDMAVAAAGKSIAAAGVDPGDVDFVLLGSCTHESSVPGGAAEVATRIGAAGAGALDINAACASFCYALAAANDAIRSGSARRVVVVGADRFTNVLDHTDRNTAFLFGDGAGAAVVGAADVAGIGPVVWGSDGTLRGLIAQPSARDAMRSEAGMPVVRMDGPAVFRWAVTAIAPIALRACAAAGVELSDLGAFVPHQANARIIDALVRALRLPNSVVVARDVVNVGNTSSASIPLALARLAESGEVPSGAPVLLVGFGAGLTYAAQVVLMP